MGYWGHGKLQRWTGDGIGEVQLILLREALVLGVDRSAVLCDEGVHRDVSLYDRWFPPRLVLLKFLNEVE